MEQCLKEPKRGTIQSFFSSRTAKKQKSDTSLISSTIIVSQSYQINQIDSTFLTSEQQEEYISLSSSESSSSSNKPISNTTDIDRSITLLCLSIYEREN